ncbi:MAG: GntR family transcriptional regulator [Candidatus Aerophobetes bacterium]|nr:GntR family transcriptional regulator [Candidatus Aerophobetes bacterium]
MKKRVYSEIKRRIVFLDYKPGQFLYTKELMKEFEISLTPIREALIYLEAEGLIHIIPNRGAYVSEVSFQSLQDVFEVRLFLIGQSGRLAAQRITNEELAKLEKLLKKIKQEKKRKLLIQLDAEFHDLVNQATQNKALAKTLERLRNQVARLWLFTREENDTYSSQIPEDFEELIKALKKKDQSGSEQILRNHVIHFIDQVKVSLYAEKGVTSVA